jgi:hypothetical protein
MVKPESYEFSTRKMPAEIADHSGKVSVSRLERAANGTWSAAIIISLSFDLKDGRKVTVDRQVRLRGAQEGKRPHPNPFGSKKNPTPTKRKADKR